MARYRVGIETRDRILSATRDLLATSGIDAVTLRSITQRAGVGAGSFYNQFASKDEVVFEVVRESIEAVDPDPDGSGTEDLQALVDAFVAFMTDSAPIARIYVQLAVGRGLVDPTIAARVARAHRRRVQRFAAAWRRHDPTLDEAGAQRRAEVLLASLTGLGISALMDEEFDMHAHARDLVPDAPARGDRVAVPESR